MEAAFFDLDKTVIAKASMVAFGGPLRRAGLIDRRLLARAAWNGFVYQRLGADDERMQRFQRAASGLTRGWERDTITSLVTETLAEVIVPLVYAEAVELIDEHRRDGRLVYLVSASPEEIVAPLGRHLGIDRVIASQARLDEDGRYTGEVELYAYGPQKAEAVRAEADELGIDLERSYAYSDSVTDLPLLRAVGHPVVVNPDRALAAVAAEEGWPVLRFDRVARRATRLVVGAAVAGGAAVGGAVWWLVVRRPPRGRRLRRPAAS
jgi:HAD superfamily hydrolase (TIGR01490 family)